MRMFQKTDHMQNMCSQFPKKGVPIRANIVDTPLTGVNTMLQTQDKIMQTGQVVSTLVQVVSTLETAPRTPSSQSGTVCRH
ncbi:hypothetical protein Taro_056580 [Colocasia esculenta]|uniref:Uncharacterized protein n=1 Tax=Colocasia esculenta TaxID=4460 RepID=A0A843XXT9_COLES|nr:hypothetical protein [Colocasia esculenta]